MKKYKKIILSGVVLLGVILLSANYIVKAIFYELIENVNNDEDYPLEITYEKTRFNVFARNVTLLNIEFAPKSNSDFVQGKLRIHKLKIENIKIGDLLKSKYVVGEIEVLGPQVEIYTVSDSTTKENVQPHDVGTLFTWKKLKIRNGTVKFFDSNTNLEKASLTGISLTLGSNDNKSLREFFSDGAFETGMIGFNLSKDDRLHAKSSVININKGRLKFNNITLSNFLDKEPYFKTSSNAHFWKKMESDSLIISGIKTVNPDSLIIGNIHLHGLFFYGEHLQYKKKNTQDKITRFKWPNNFYVKNFSVDKIKGVYKFKKFNDKAFRSIELQSSSFRLSQGSIAYLLGQTDSILWDGGETDNVRLGGVIYHLGNQHKLKFDKLHVNISKKKLSLNGFQLINQIEPTYFIRKLSFHKDWKDIRIDSVHSEFNLLNIVKHQYWVSNKTDIYGFYLDLREPGDILKKPDKQSELVHDWLRAIPFNHELRNIKVYDSRIDYKIYFDETVNVGSIHFVEMNGFIDQISNLNKSLTTTLDFEALAYGKYKARLITKMKPYNINYIYTLRGKVGRMPLTKLNVLINPMGLHIQKGYMHQLDFKYDSKGFDSHAIGSTIFKYENLKLKILEEHIEEKVRLNGKVKPAKTKKNKVIAWALNKLVKENNMPNQPYYIEGKIDRERELYQSFFGQMIHCMIQGAEYCVSHKKHPKKRKR